MNLSHLSGDPQNVSQENLVRMKEKLTGVSGSNVG